MAQALGGVPNKFEEARDHYVANYGVGKFYISTNPYYSTVGFKWKLELESAIKTPAGDTKMVAVLEEQEHEFFSYGLRDSLRPYGLGERPATDAETNVLVKHKTNQEDFVIEGLSAHCVGHRIVCAIPGHRNPHRSLREALEGKTIIHDPGSFVLPAEVGSPMLLEQGLYGQVAKGTTLAPSWNRRVEDYLGLLRLLPEGGANSYLRANGEPTHHNFFRIPEGWEWTREGSPEDTMFSLTARVERPVTTVITLPKYLDGNEPGDVIWPLEIYTIVQISLHGRSFYVPSKNA